MERVQGKNMIAMPKYPEISFKRRKIKFSTKLQETIVD